MEANLKLDHELLAVEEEHAVHAMIELAAPSMAQDDATSASVAVVIDRSGSMQGAKLDVTKRCVEFLIRRLRPADQFALVQFDDNVDLVAALDTPDQDRLVAAVSAIQAGGSTNLSGGWLKGMEQLRGAPTGTPRKVILLTDGQANVGIVDSDQLTGLAGHAHADGIRTTTIGFGDGFNEDLLDAMAKAGGGNMHFAATPDAAPAIFASEVEGLVSVVAQNVSVEIRPGDDVQLLGVLNDYPITEVPGGLHVNVGDAYSDERRRVVFQLRIPNLVQLGPAKVADIVIRYTELAPQIAMRTITIPVLVNLVSADEARTAVPDAEVVEEVLVLQTARTRDEAIRMADAGDAEGARRLLMARSDELKRIAPASPRAAELLDHAATLDDSSFGLSMGYDPALRKKLKFESSQIHRGQWNRDSRHRDLKKPRDPDGGTPGSS